MRNYIGELIAFLRRKINNIGGARRYRWTKIAIYFGLSLLVFGIVYESFFSREDVETSVGANKIEKKTEDVAHIGISSIKTLNPIVSTDEDTRYLTPLIYRGLFTLDETLTPKLDLAESFNFSEKSVEISLREAKWEDGQAINGDDVVFTIRAIKKAGPSSPYGKFVDKIKDVDNNGNKVRIYFKDSKDMSLHYLQFPIIPSHKYKSVDSFLKDDDFQPVGSGLYKCGNFNNEKGMTLYPNDNFYGEKATSLIKVIIVSDEDAKNNFLESGNISVLLNKDVDRSGKFTKEGVKIDNFPSNQVELLAFNTKSPMVDKSRVRRAIAKSVDIDSIIEEDYLGSAIKNSSLYLDGYMGSSKSKKYSYDKDEAEALLKKAGYSDENKDGVLEDEDGNKLTLNFVVDKDSFGRVGAAQRISKSLKSLGIEVDIKALSAVEMKKTIASGNYDVALVGMSTDENHDFRSLIMTGGSNNLASYTSDEMDKTLNSLYSGATLEKAKSDIESIKNILYDDMPYYCICYRTYGIVKSPVFVGEVKANFFNPYMKAESWYSEYLKTVSDKK